MACAGRRDDQFSFNKPSTTTSLVATTRTDQYREGDTTKGDTYPRGLGEVRCSKRKWRSAPLADAA